MIQFVKDFFKVDFDKADKKYKKQFYSGRKAGRIDKDYLFPYNNRYKNEDFVTILIPVRTLKPNPRNIELVDKYKGVTTPIWVSIGRKFKDGSIKLNYNRLFQIVDGNHRAAAAIKAGKEEIKATMPRSHYEFYKTLEVREDGLHSKN